MSIEGVFFDLGGTLFSYRNVARTNIPILIDSARNMGVTVDPDEIKKAYGLATRQVSHTYAKKSYYRHDDMFHDMYRHFCDLLNAQYDLEILHEYHEIQQKAMFN